MTESKKCTECKEKKGLTEFHSDKSKKYGVSSRCKECVSISRYVNRNEINANKRLFTANNPEKVKEYRDRYYPKAKDSIMRKKVIRRANDDLYRMKENLRSRARQAFSRSKWMKDSPNETLLGADYNTVFKHIESLFTKGMTWRKVGIEIHIDHKIPLASASTEQELIKLFHYKNLQPMWAVDNMRKGDRIDEKFGNT